MCASAQESRIQTAKLEGMQLDRIFTDKASGKDVKRPELEAMLRFVREGDIVVVHNMDRLARNLLKPVFCSIV